MLSALEQTNAVRQVLESSSDVLLDAVSQSKSMDDDVSEAHQRIKNLEKRAKEDRLILALCIAVFAVAALYVLKERVSVLTSNIVVRV